MGTLPLQFGYFAFRGRSTTRNDPAAKHNQNQVAKISKFARRFFYHLERDGIDGRYVNPGRRAGNFEIFHENKERSFEALEHVTNCQGLPSYAIVVPNLEIDILSNGYWSEPELEASLAPILRRCHEFDLQIFSIETKEYSFHTLRDNASSKEFGQLLMKNSAENWIAVTEYLEGLTKRGQAA